jgi:hypothetical protein
MNEEQIVNKSERARELLELIVTAVQYPKLTDHTPRHYAKELQELVKDIENDLESS